MNNIPTKCQNNSNCRWIKAWSDALLLFYGSLLGGWSSSRRVLLGLLLHAPLGGWRRRSGSGPGHGELEEAAADLLGVGLEHLYPLLDRGGDSAAAEDLEAAARPALGSGPTP